MSNLFSKKLKTVILFGPPGSGKGTLGRVLCLAGNHLHLSSGEVFRGLDPHSAGGRIFEQYASQGLLVPDEVTIDIWHDYVEKLMGAGKYNPEKQLLFLDGLPRTLKQAECLAPYIEVVQIVVLDVKNREELKRRLLRRGGIENRSDDQSLEVLQTRMQVYDKETSGLLDYYPSSLVSHFDASLRPIEVVKEVLNKLYSIF